MKEKYLYTRFGDMEEKYLYTRFGDFIWFPVPKTGTRSMFHSFRKNKLNFPVEKFQTLPDDHSNCFKFAFVRNPWARLVSTYEDKVRLQWENKNFANSEDVKYRLDFYKQFKGGSFKEFIRCIGLKPTTLFQNSRNSFVGFLNGCDRERHVQQQASLVPYNLVDFIGRFESLESDFKKLCQKMKITLHPLPRENSSTRRPEAPLHKHYTEYYDEETRQIVAEKYVTDIEYFGYEFGE